MAHLSPIHEWKSMSLCEVFASKFGAMLPSLSSGYSSATAARARRMTGEVEERGVRQVRERGEERVKKDAIVVADEVH